MGVSLTLGESGGILATYPLERAVSLIGWRNSFLIAGLLCSLFALACGPILKSARTVYRQEKTFSLQALFEVFKNRHSLPVIISGAINFGIYFLFQTTLGKKYLQDSFNISSSRAALFTFIMMITNTGFAFISGYTSRLIGLRRPIIRTATTITLTATIILFLNLLLTGNANIVLSAYILLAISAAVAPIYVTTIKEMNSVKVVATSVGFLNAMTSLFIAFLGYGAGCILDAFKDSAVEIAGIIIYPDFAYRMIYLLCIVLALFSFLICFSIKETGNGQKA